MKLVLGVLVIFVTGTIVQAEYAQTHSKTIKRPTATIIVKCKHYLKKVPYLQYELLQGNLNNLCDNDYYRTVFSRDGRPDFQPSLKMNPPAQSDHPAKIYVQKNISQVRGYSLPQVAYNFGTSDIKRIKRGADTGYIGKPKKLAKHSNRLGEALKEVRSSVKNALSIGFQEAREISSEDMMTQYDKELDDTLHNLGTIFSRVLRAGRSNKIRKRMRKRLLPRPKLLKDRKRTVKTNNKMKMKIPRPREVIHGTRTRRLIASMDGMIEEYPYVVSIQKNDQHWCAGVILNPRLVLTTANCVWKSTMKTYMRVRACSRFSDSGGQKTRIQEILKHPKWNIRMNPDFDVALLLLDRDLKFSHSCHAADLPNRAMKPVFNDAWVTSWGAERRDGNYVGGHRPLQVYHSKLLEREQCNNSTLRFGVAVSENFICMKQEGGRAPCTRDTGAPAVSDGVVWGLASWGIRKPCGTERYPAMFTYLAADAIQNFIIAGTKRLMSDFRESPFLDIIRVPSLPSLQVPEGEKEKD